MAKEMSPQRPIGRSRFSFSWAWMTTLIIVLVAGWLGWLGRDVYVQSRLFGVFSIQNKSIPVACKNIMTQLINEQAALKSEGDRVAELQSSAVEYDKKYNGPDYVRFWIENGHLRSEENWKHVTEARIVMRDSLEKSSSLLQSIKQECVK